MKKIVFLSFLITSLATFPANMRFIEPDEFELEEAATFSYKQQVALAALLKKKRSNKVMRSVLHVIRKNKNF